MPQVINTNIASLNAQKNLNRSQNSLQVSLQRLSSGLRINSAKDDAAGLAIAEKMTTQIRGMNQAIRNSNDGISLAQTGEGALGEVINNLQRIRELAVQSANGIYTTGERTALNDEVSERVAEIIRVAENAEFNGVKLFDGTTTSVQFQVGANNTTGDRVSVSLVDLSAGVTADVSTVTGAQAAIDAVDSVLASVNGARSTFGAAQNRFESIVANLESSVENLSASRGRILDADFAAETASLTRATILQNAGIAMLSQANALPQNVLSLLQ